MMTKELAANRCLTLKSVDLNLHLVKKRRREIPRILNQFVIRSLLLPKTQGSHCHFSMTEMTSVGCCVGTRTRGYLYHSS